MKVRLFCLTLHKSSLIPFAFLFDCVDFCTLGFYLSSVLIIDRESLSETIKEQSFIIREQSFIGYLSIGQRQRQRSLQGTKAPGSKRDCLLKACSSGPGYQQSTAGCRLPWERHLHLEVSHLRTESHLHLNCKIQIFPPKRRFFRDF